jgi:FAD:protein FMN transferase
LDEIVRQRLQSEAASTELSDPSPQQPLRSLHNWFEKLVDAYATRNPAVSPAIDTPPAEKSNSESSDIAANATDSSQLHPAQTQDSSSELSSLMPSWWRLGLPQISCPMQSISRPAMACEFEFLLNERQYSGGVERAVEALGLIERVEDLLSVYRPQSQFSKLNQFASQRPVRVDALTLEVIQLAIDVHRWTDGCFDLTAGSLSETWGFSRREGKMPTQQQITAALSTVGSQHIIVDESASTVFFARDGIKLNPGGIGKGYALDRAASYLSRSGIHDYMIHGGLSSIIARGSRHNLSSEWVVALKHPWRTEELLETFPLRDQALGTSGSGKQFFHFGGKRYSHLIDPRTGWPAQQMMSVTIVCPSCGIADALATGLFIMGVDGAIQYCERNPDVAALLIHTDPKSGSQRIDRRNWHLVEA